jgi:hypothetical protein
MSGTKVECRRDLRVRGNRMTIDGRCIDRAAKRADWAGRAFVGSIARTAIGDAVAVPVRQGSQTQHLWVAGKRSLPKRARMQRTATGSAA